MFMYFQISTGFGKETIVRDTVYVIVMKTNKANIILFLIVQGGMKVTLTERSMKSSSGITLLPSTSVSY